MSRSVAVFDIDRTIVSGTSSERIFIRFLLGKRELRLTNGFNFLCHFLATIPRSRVLATKGNRYYLKGKEPDHIGELAEKCFRTEIIPRISDTARALIEEHRRSGLKIVLLSGTPDFLLRQFREYIRADSAHGSVMEIVDGRYTGRMTGLFPYGKGKVEIVREYFEQQEYDLSKSYAYGDHETDLEFLKLFGHPTLVNPDPKLATKAEKMGVSIARFL